MRMNRIGKSSDFISECGMFKISASNSPEDSYLPMIRMGDGKDKPIIFVGMTEDFVSFEDAKEVLSNY